LQRRVVISGAPPKFRQTIAFLVLYLPSLAAEFYVAASGSPGSYDQPWDPATDLTHKFVEIVR